MKVERGSRSSVALDRRSGTAVDDCRHQTYLLRAIIMRVFVFVFVTCQATFAMTLDAYSQTAKNILPGMTIEFIGFTNDIRGTAGVYRFTNSSPRKVTFQVTTVEHEAPNGWTKILPPQFGSRGLHSYYQGPSGKPGFDTGVGFTRTLAPAGTAVGLFNATDTNVVWRIRAFCVEEATGVLGVVDRGKELVRNLETGGKTKIYSGRKYFATLQTGQTKNQKSGKSNGNSSSP